MVDIDLLDIDLVDIDLVDTDLVNTDLVDIDFVDLVDADLVEIDLVDVLLVTTFTRSKSSLQYRTTTLLCSMQLSARQVRFDNKMHLTSNVPR